MYKRLMVFLLSVMLCVPTMQTGVHAQDIDEKFQMPEKAAAVVGEKDTDGNGITDNGYIYSANATDKTAIISGYVGNATTLTIPTVITVVGTGTPGSYNVTIIGSGAFRGKGGLTSVIIPKGIVSIGDFAFYGCMQMAKITISETVSSIGYQALADCVLLNGITVTAGNSHYRVIDGSLFQYTLGANGLYGYTLIQYPLGKSGTAYTAPTEASLKGRLIGVGPGAFLGSMELTKISLPETVSAIGDSAFKGCRVLTDVNIPAGVSTIGDSTFYECVSLKTVALPKDLKSLGGNAFSGCTKLTELNLPEKITGIGTGTFQNCTELEELTIPYGVTSLGSSAFSGCKSLQKIVVPTTVLSMGYNAFSGCSLLTMYCHTGSAASTYAKANNIKTMFTYTVSFYDGGKLISKQEVMPGDSAVPPVLASRDGYELGWSADYTVIASDTTVSSVWTRVYYITFRDAYWEKSVTVSTPVGEAAKAPAWTMSNYRLSWDRSFSSVTGDMVVNAVWTNKTNGYVITKDTKRPADYGSVLTVGNMEYMVTNTDPSGPRVRFTTCTNEKAASITIPSAITVDDVRYSVTAIEEAALKERTALKSVTIGSNVVTIYENAFYRCKNLGNVRILSKKVTKIGTKAFGSIRSTAIIRVPRTKFTSYKNLLKKSGIGSRVSVRSL